MLFDQLESCEAHTSPQVEEESVTTSSIKMKQPRIEIPKFNGNYLTWRQFHDLFSEMIHKQDLRKTVVLTRQFDR